MIEWVRCTVTQQDFATSEVDLVALTKTAAPYINWIMKYLKISDLSINAYALFLVEDIGKIALRPGAFVPETAKVFCVQIKGLC